MKTWLVIVSVIAALLAASTGVGFWMWSSTETELASTQAELASTQAELTVTKAQLTSMQDELAETEAELADAEAELAECRENGVGSDVQITYIFYDGVVPQTESDEYVEITNLGDTSQDLEGWILKDMSEGYPSFTFPSYVLAPGAEIRVYTNEIHPEWGGFGFGYIIAIWNNSDPDWAALYNDQGQEVSRKSY